MVNSAPGSTALAGLVMVLAPMKLVIAESSVVLRLRWVSFSNCAVSLMLTFTVKMSPT